MLELKAPPARKGPNTGSLAPGVRKRVKKNDCSPKFKTLIVPFLYALQLFDFTPFHAFADHSQAMEVGTHKKDVIKNLGRKIVMMTKRLRDLGMSVN